MKITSTFTILRYWFKSATPADVLETLNYKQDTPYPAVPSKFGHPYVDVAYTGESDKNITMMELRYQEWILDREFISYDVEGDDGL